MTLRVPLGLPEQVRLREIVPWSVRLLVGVLVAVPEELMQPVTVKVWSIDSVSVGEKVVVGGRVGVRLREALGDAGEGVLEEAVGVREERVWE